MFDILTVDFFQFNLMGLNLITIICNHCLIISYSILIFSLVVMILCFNAGNKSPMSDQHFLY